MEKEKIVHLLLEAFKDSIDAPTKNLNEEYNAERFYSLIPKLDRIAYLLEKLIVVIKITAKDVLDIEEASIYSSLSSSDLYKKNCKRIIPFSKPGGKQVFFKKEDLDNYKLSNPIK